MTELEESLAIFEEQVNITEVNSFILICNCNILELFVRKTEHFKMIFLNAFLLVIGRFLRYCTLAIAIIKQ